MSEVADKRYVKPWQGTGLARLKAGVLVVFAVTLFVATSSAWADEVPVPTAQATAYHADWVPYLDPPEKPAAVCLVDSGVNVTPDTPEDSPEGPIVKRLALDGGPGTAASTSWEGLHGTLMAFVGAAPINGWGAVGFWPGVRIVSIRAMPMGEATFPFDNYARAIDLCTKSAVSERIVAVNLSLGCKCGVGAAERELLGHRVVAAHANDISVVAAAGNRSGQIESPADATGVLAVAAGNEGRGLCAFSNRGDAIELIAPGCGLDMADPTSTQVWSGYEGGTSSASVTVAAVLALVRSYVPGLGWKAAEQLIEQSGTATANGVVLDVESLFIAAGLGHLVDLAKSRMPATAPAEGSLDPDRGTDQGLSSTWIDPAEAGGGATTPARLPRPKIRVTRAGRWLRVTVTNRSSTARVAVTVQLRRGEFRYRSIVRRQQLNDVVRIKLPRRDLRQARLEVRQVDTTSVARNSDPVHKALPR